MVFRLRSRSLSRGPVSSAACSWVGFGKRFCGRSRAAGVHAWLARDLLACCGRVLVRQRTLCGYCAAGIGSRFWHIGRLSMAHCLIVGVLILRNGLTAKRIDLELSLGV